MDQRIHKILYLISKTDALFRIDNVNQSFIGLATGSKEKSNDVNTSVAVLADLSLRWPQKLLIFIIKKKYL